MTRTRVWGDIDRTAFFENAILLELKNRAQGEVIQVRSRENSSEAGSAANVYHYPTEDLLDDLALVSAGPGGKDNVTAVCLEVARDWARDRTLIVRAARNGGADGRLMEEIQNLFTAFTPEMRVEDAVATLSSRIVDGCYGRLRKHASRLGRLTQILRWSKTHHFPRLPFDTHAEHAESAEDIASLGQYSRETHVAFVEKQKRRLEEIAATVTAQILQLTKPELMHHLERLAQLCYSLRKSSTARMIIQQSISRLPSHTTNVLRIEDVMFRIGQLSKFARAAHNIAGHAREMSESGITVRVEVIHSKLFAVPELARRTARDLRARGARRFMSMRDEVLQGKIQRWQSYREHAEIQLIMYYEQHPEIVLCSTYIGCNKLSCFLCFHFMQQHGRFRSRGCHQSLYSLWTVRDFIKTNDGAAGERIMRALAYLSETMESTVAAQREENWRRPGVGPAPESVVNLSRLSLALGRPDVGEGVSAEPRPVRPAPQQPFSTTATLPLIAEEAGEPIAIPPADLETGNSCELMLRTTEEPEPPLQRCSPDSIPPVPVTLLLEVSDCRYDVQASCVAVHIARERERRPLRTHKRDISSSSSSRHGPRRHGTRRKHKRGAARTRRTTPTDQRSGTRQHGRWRKRTMCFARIRNALVGVLFGARIRERWERKWRRRA